MFIVHTSSKSGVKISFCTCQTKLIKQAKQTTVMKIISPDGPSTRDKNAAIENCKL